MKGTVRQRFWHRVIRAAEHPGELDTCWRWTGATIRGGYGMLYVAPRVELAHRVAWRLFVGAIPNGYEVCHRCDVPNCVNPAHLFVDTHAANMRDATCKGRNGAHRHPECVLRGVDNPSHQHPERLRRGMAHYRARLTPENIRAIRSGRQGGRTTSAIARAYGVGRETIAAILAGRTWRHVV